METLFSLFNGDDMHNTFQQMSQSSIFAFYLSKVSTIILCMPNRPFSVSLGGAKSLAMSGSSFFVLIHNKLNEILNSNCIFWDFVAYLSPHLEKAIKAL